MMLGSQKYIIAEPLVLGPHPFEDEIATAKLKHYKSLAIESGLCID